MEFLKILRSRPYHRFGLFLFSKTKKWETGTHVTSGMPSYSALVAMMRCFLFFYETHKPTLYFINASRLHRRLPSSFMQRRLWCVFLDHDFGELIRIQHPAFPIGVFAVLIFILGAALVNVK